MLDALADGPQDAFRLTTRQRAYARLDCLLSLSLTVSFRSAGNHSTAFNPLDISFSAVIDLLEKRRVMMEAKESMCAE
jgi:hypothetical protein